MKFSLFGSVRSTTPVLCTPDVFTKVSESQQVAELCKQIAATVDDEKRGELKKLLPIITWQAFFVGPRKAANARPSGMYMLDIDHVDNPYELYSEKICKKIRECNILYVGKTPSTHGLRIVALRPDNLTIEDCQKWLASQLNVEYDQVCKDMSRASFVVPLSYIYYMNNKIIFYYEPKEDPVATTVEETPSETVSHSDCDSIDEGEPQPTESYTHKGIPIEKIAKTWLHLNGGEPQKGERNARLYSLCTRLRYICDFDERTLLNVMPRYGLDEKEMKQLIHSAVSSVRRNDIPDDLLEAIKKSNISNIDDEDITDDGVDLTDTSKVPSLPPIFREMYDIAPEDFKIPATLCQLPILGTLGSKIRAKYIDGVMHSPTFQVSLEAPQASGKSFMRRLVEYELAGLKKHDEEEREREREYDEKIKELKLINVKINEKNKAELLGTRPVPIIRFVPPTMSITKLLIRQKNARGLHLFAFAEEIDTVYKTFKRGFSSYSDALRCSFDNAEYGQDYASENSFSGLVKLYYNALFSGTPKAMRRFYPDIEDGLVSRVIFVTMKDQFGKKMPVWKEMTEKQKLVVDTSLVKLSEVSIINDHVQDEHIMKMDFVNKAMEIWIEKQQNYAVLHDDRTRDIFCRRSAVNGFRAGMLAFFLWGEKNTPQIRKNVVDFAIWVANLTLNQHLLRFNVNNNVSNTFRCEDVFKAMPQEFTFADLDKKLLEGGYKSPARQIVYQWKLLGLIKKEGKKYFKIY